MDCKRIAEGVYSLANSPDDPLAPLVKEALEVIDHALDTHGCVEVLVTEYDGPVDDLIFKGKTASLLASMVERTVSFPSLCQSQYDN